MNRNQESTDTICLMLQLRDLKIEHELTPEIHEILDQCDIMLTACDALINLESVFEHDGLTGCNEWFKGLTSTEIKKAIPDNSNFFIKVFKYLDTIKPQVLERFKTKETFSAN